MKRKRFERTLWGMLVCIAIMPSAFAQQWADWTAPTNLGGAVNTAIPETAPALSKNGLTLIIEEGRARTPNYGGRDIWIAQRASVEEPWTTASLANAGANLNSIGHDEQPALSPDEHKLFFGSDRPGGFGGFDLYVSRRHNRRDDFGWNQPINLGPDINTSADEDGPAIYEDDTTGKIYLYFASNRYGNLDIFVSELQADDTFGPPQLVANINGAQDDYGPFISLDGLELYFTSANRPGGYGRGDIWVSRRTSIAEPWTEPVNLGPTINSIYNEVSPTLSFDESELYYGVAFNPANFGPPPVAGQFQYDVWRATREKVKAESAEQ